MTPNSIAVNAAVDAAAEALGVEHATDIPKAVIDAFVVSDAPPGVRASLVACVHQTKATPFLAFTLAYDGPPGIWERHLAGAGNPRARYEHLSSDALLALAAGMRLSIDAEDGDWPSADVCEIIDLVSAFLAGAPVGPLVRAVCHYNIHRAVPVELKA